MRASKDSIFPSMTARVIWCSQKAADDFEYENSVDESQYRQQPAPPGNSKPVPAYVVQEYEKASHRGCTNDEIYHVSNPLRTHAVEVL
jgi:hypothetical protein